MSDELHGVVYDKSWLHFYRAATAAALALIIGLLGYVGNRVIVATDLMSAQITSNHSDLIDKMDTNDAALRAYIDSKNSELWSRIFDHEQRISKMETGKDK